MEQLKASIAILARLAMDSERLTDEERSAIAFVAGYTTGDNAELNEIFDKIIDEE